MYFHDFILYMIGYYSYDFSKGFSRIKNLIILMWVFYAQAESLNVLNFMFLNVIITDQVQLN